METSRTAKDMNFNYHSKMDYRGSGEEGKGETKPGDEAKAENGRMYYGCRSEVEESEAKTGLGKDGPVTASKPSDVKNGDLVSLLLAATPPYLYNIPLIPQTFFFSEMLKSFVQAKTERQNLKAQQTHHKRQRKRSWREMTPPKPTYYDSSDKPLELTTPKQPQPEDKVKERAPKRSDAGDKKYQSSDLGSSNFTAEKLANSSVSSSGVPDGSSTGTGDLLPPTPPLWYPPLYPPHPPFGIDPLHFFIDLRVSAHVWDRKLTADKLSADPTHPGSPLNLRADVKDLRDRCASALEPSLTKNRHKSAFTVPQPRRPPVDGGTPPKRSPHSVHYLMSNLKNIYKAKEAEVGVVGDDGEDRPAIKKDEDEEEEGGGGGKKCKDLRALIGLELVVDYVKQESDGSDDDEHGESVNVEQVPGGESSA